MEIDEKLFHFAWKTKKRFSKKVLSPNASLLTDHQSRLTSLTSAFIGESLNLKPAETNGALIGNSLFLPAIVEDFEDKDENYKLYMFRVLYESIAFHCGYNLKEGVLKRDDLNFLSLIALPTLLKKLITDFPTQSEVLNNFTQTIRLKKIKSKDKITIEYINKIIQKQTIDEIDSIFTDTEIEFFELLEKED